MFDFSLARPRWGLTLVALLWSASAWADGHALGSRQPMQVVQLSASGSLEVAQDLLTIGLSTTREGADAASVQGQLKQVLDAALTEARRSAQPGAMDVRTGNLGLQPRYGRDGKINGWQGSAELVLEGKDIVRVSTAAGRINTLSISSVGFSLSRDKRLSVESEVQAQAIERFRARATEIAQAFGFTGYTLREVSVGSSDQTPMPRVALMSMQAKSAMAEAQVPVEAGKSTVVITVSGSVQLTR